MNEIKHGFASLIGNTPLLALDRVCEIEGIDARLCAKLEYFNPAGSVKDRIGLGMIEDAERRGAIKPGALLVEPTSGNTGIGLAAVAACKGYEIVLTMPDSMSVERRMLLAAYGAKLVLTPGRLGMKGAIAEAEKIAREHPGSLLVGQFVNPANPQTHYDTTGPEIWRQTDGEIDAFVAGIGTGGTITGIGRFLRERNAAVRLIGVEPDTSPVLTQGKSGPHGLMGIGAGFVPDTLDVSLLDEVLPVSTEEAYAAARMLAKTEGVLVGISSGAALHAAMQVAKRSDMAGKTVVTLLPDGGDRYLSSPLFAMGGGLEE